MAGPRREALPLEKAKMMLTNQNFSAKRLNQFWELVNKAGPVSTPLGTACWLWEGTKDAHGYGRFRAGGEQLAHRVSLSIHLGGFPKKLGALHHCDNPSCVRPQHLYAGDQAANIRDMWLRGRVARKLSVQDVHAIRSSSLNFVALATIYGVTRQNIGCIVRRQTWRHV